MFIKNLCLIVNNDKAFLSEPITIFLGDKDIRLQIMLKQVRNQFNTKVLNDLDVLDSVESCEVAIQKPNGELFTATAHVENKIVIIDIDSTWTDELAEVGVHLVQLILLSGDGGHITLPTVEVMVAKPLEVREEGSEQIISDLYTENGIALLSEDGNGLKISELPININAYGYVPFISMMNTGRYETQRFLFDMSQIAFKGYVNYVLEDEMVFNNSDVTLQSIGGIKAGESLNGLTIHEILNRMIFPSTVDVSASLSYSPIGRVFEKGSVVTVTGIKGDALVHAESLNSIKYYDGENVIYTEYHTDFGYGSQPFYYDFTQPIEITDSITSDRFRVSANTDSKSNFANTTELTFVYPYYYGVVDTIDTDDNLSVSGSKIEITGDDLKAMTKLVQTRDTKKIFYTTKNQHCVFAYPSSYGMLMRISDQNGFDSSNSFSVRELLVECADGTTQSYYVYVNRATTLDNFHLTFYHEYY